jgi:hypothetical protein
MRVGQLLYRPDTGWTDETPAPTAPQLVLAFVDPHEARGAAVSALVERFPGARVVAATTGGEILGRDVHEGTAVAVAVELERSRVVVEVEPLAGAADSGRAARALGERLCAPDLRAVFVLSDGLDVNGSELVLGLRASVGDGVIIVGGLAGDGARFGETRVGVDGALAPHRLVGMGFVGEALEVGHGSCGGWRPYGPERVITRAEGNVLYALDDEPALELYKRYLGPEAAQLPSSGLHYPLTIRRPDAPDTELVRTVLSIDEGQQSLTFAGDVPQGAIARLMRARVDEIVEGAERAAEAAGDGELAVLVSCIGRRLLLGQRVGEEVEAVEQVLGEGCARIGYYSYGEISPHAASGIAELHNQTMTITTFRERAA